MKCLITDSISIGPLLFVVLLEDPILFVLPLVPFLYEQISKIHGSFGVYKL